jgi:D-threonate/D-erythronate kinase
MQNGIIVIADDFTGAAELAGICLRYGLKPKLCLSIQELASINLDDGCIVSTDSRSKKKQEALAITKQYLDELVKANPVLLFKKIDSVLRGYIIEELKIQMQVLGSNKAIIVAANPSLGRTINNGKYYLNGIEITKTDFANDPEFPVKTDFVNEILNEPSVEVRSVTSILPSQGIIVAEANSETDMQEWASKIDAEFALIGAGDFFTALLDKKYIKHPQPEPIFGSPFLYIVGSAFDSVKKRVANWKLNAKSIKQIHQFFSLLEMNDSVYLLIIESVADGQSALELREAMALVVQELIHEFKVVELFVEGGSTAAAVLKQLNIQLLEPVNELSRGVVRMKTVEFYITVKPGSYQLPQLIERLLQKE